MAPKKASAIASRLKTALTKLKSKPSTSTPPEAGADTTGTPQKVVEAPPRASEDTIRTEIRAPKQADASNMELFPDFAEPARSETSSKTATPRLVSSPPPTLTSRPTSARPCDIMSAHASLLPTCGPQPAFVDLPTELSQPGLTFTSPLPINPAAAPLSRAHFKCPTNHASRLKPSSNAHAPTLCATCHRSGDVVLAQCRCCSLRICKRCAGLLGRCGNDLEKMLGELVRLGVWKGLQGQG